MVLQEKNQFYNSTSNAFHYIIILKKLEVYSAHFITCMASDMKDTKQDVNLWISEILTQKWTSPDMIMKDEFTEP